MKVRRYDLGLDIDHAGLAYRGKVALHLDHDGGPLLVHAIDLDIEKVSSRGKALSWQPVPKEEGFRVDGLAAGETVVEVEFRGKVPEMALMGIYRSDYGPTHAIVTQLEPLGARRVFPCIDHPAQKAEFHLTATVDEGLQVIFNTPVASEKRQAPANGGAAKVVRTFQPTPRMSTYLIFLGVGKFEERSVTRGKQQIIVATPPGKGDQASFALEHAVKILDFFERYFEVPYPLPKLHLVAVPNTAVGGMENWGAIAFRERVLLVADDAAQTTLRSVVGVLAHEIAHQWFGDLVTMAWWNDLWLNESFATFMDYKCTSHLHPDWEVWSDFAGGTSNAQLWDALPHSHPISVPVEDPNQISGIFDEISYAKGGSILRMVEAYIGEENFRQGVSRYLKKFAYSNAKGEDLWGSIDVGLPSPIAPVLRAWVDRPGYPSVRARHRSGKLELEQHRFLLTKNGGMPAGSDDPWPLPINVLADGKAAGHLMAERTLSLPLADASGVVVGHGRRSFARVAYEGDLGKNLRARFPTLGPWDRWGLFQDSYAFLLAGELEPPAYLELFRACAEERSYIVLKEFLNQAGLLHGVLHDVPYFLDVARATLQVQQERMGLAKRPKESAWEGILREGFVSARATLDPPFCASLASRWESIDQEEPGLRRSIASSYARTAGSSAYDPILTKLKAAKTDEERTRLAGALGAFKDPGAIERSLSLAFSGEVSPTTGIDIMVGVLGNPDAWPTMWEGLKQALPFLVQAFQGSGIVPILLQWAVPFLGIGREPEVRAFFADQDVGDGKRGLEKGFDLLAIHLRVRALFEKAASSRPGA